MIKNAGMGLTWGEHMANVKNEMIVCCYHPILKEASPATPWSWKSLIELNEKASGQNVTVLGL